MLTKDHWWVILVYLGWKRRFRCEVEIKYKHQELTETNYGYNSTTNKLIMKITNQQPITKDNVFEQMALMTKKKLIDQGILPDEANKLAIEFVKERGEQVIKNVAKQVKYE